MGSLGCAKRRGKVGSTALKLRDWVWQLKQSSWQHEGDRTEWGRAPLSSPSELPLGITDTAAGKKSHVHTEFFRRSWLRRRCSERCRRSRGGSDLCGFYRGFWIWCESLFCDESESRGKSGSDRGERGIWGRRRCGVLQAYPWLLLCGELGRWSLVVQFFFSGVFSWITAIILLFLLKIWIS